MTWSMPGSNGAWTKILRWLHRSIRTKPLEIVPSHTHASRRRLTAVHQLQLCYKSHNPLQCQVSCHIVTTALLLFRIILLATDLASPPPISTLTPHISSEDNQHTSSNNSTGNLSQPPLGIPSSSWSSMYARPLWRNPWCLSWCPEGTSIPTGGGDTPRTAFLHELLHVGSHLLDVAPHPYTRSFKPDRGSSRKWCNTQNSH
jgi:hypothetical protein